MAFGIIATQSAVFGSSGGTTTAINTTGANLIIVNIWWNTNTNTTPNLSDSAGNSWTKAVQSNTNGACCTVCFYCVSPTTSSSHTFTSTNHFMGIGVLAVNGSATVSPLGATSANDQGGSGSIQPGSLTPTNSNALFVTSFESFNGTTPTPPTGYTILGLNTTSTAEAGGMCFKTQSTAAAENPTWNDSGGTNQGVVLAYFNVPSSFSIPQYAGNFFLFF